MTQDHKIWNFNAADPLYIFLKDWRNALIIYKCQKLKISRRLGRVKTKI